MHINLAQIIQHHKHPASAEPRASGVVTRGRANKSRKNCLLSLTLNFGLSQIRQKIFFFVKTFRLKMQNLGLKTLVKFRGNIAIFSLHNIFCRNFATFYLAYFFNPRCCCSQPLESITHSPFHSPFHWSLPISLNNIG